MSIVRKEYRGKGYEHVFLRQSYREEPVFQRVTTPTPLQQRAFELLGVALT